MSRIFINNMSYNGNSISISGNKIIIDGKDVTPDSKIITIQVDGNIGDLSADSCEKIKVNGHVTKLKTMSGDVDVKGDVLGDIQTMSGDVKCGNVKGSVKTMSGDINGKF